MSDRGGKETPLQPPSLLMGGLHLAALWALAIVQPLLNLLGKNPDFFVARDNTGGQIIVFVLLLAILPALAATLVEFVIKTISPIARWYFHLGLCGVLFAAIALQILKQFADSPAWPMIGLALVLGGLLTWAYAKARFMRSMADILIVAPPVILISFFFFSESSELVKPAPEVTGKEIVASDPAPVVMVIFDEFPAGSLMTPSGKINPKRFPNFSQLQKTSTWYPNTATNASFTAIAVPSILTAQDAKRDNLPTAADHPDSIFTLLGKDWKTQAIEPITQLCPEDVCGEREESEESMGDALSSLTTDLKAVSAHLLLPSSMGKDLPDISQSFQGFGGQVEDSVVRGRARQWVRDRLDAGEESLDGEGDVGRFLKTLPADGQTFDFLHVEEPHYPWTHYPSGLKYSDGTEDFRTFTEDMTWNAPPYVTDRAHQAHLLEVGFVDNLIGRIINGLKKRGRWDETLFVVTADHGAAWTPGQFRREAATDTMGQIATVPLFIKAPGQDQGETVEQPTCITEIVPEMADILGIELPWEADPCDRETIRMDNGTGPKVELSFEETLAQRQVYIDSMAKLLGGDGADWDRAFRWGPNKDLIGRSASDLVAPLSGSAPKVSPEPSGTRNSAFNPGVKYNPVLRQRGSINGLDADQPLAVAVNDEIAAVGQTYTDGGATKYSILIPESALKRGRNKVDLYAVTESGDAAGSPGLNLLWTSADQ